MLNSLLVNKKLNKKLELMRTKHKSISCLEKDLSYETDMNCGYCISTNSVPREESSCIFNNDKKCSRYEYVKHIYGSDYLMHIT